VAVPHDGLAGAQEHDDAPRMRWVLVGEEAPPEHAQAMVPTQINYLRGELHPPDICRTFTL
jgi:hypothetical protein